MGAELHDLVVDIVVHAVAVADSALSSLVALYSAGMPNGLDIGPLAAGAAAGGVAGAAAGTGGSNVGRNDLTSLPTTRGHDTDQRLHEDGVAHEHFGEGGTVTRENWRGDPATPVLRFSRTLQKWAESAANWYDPDHGPDDVWTVPAGGKA